jgi:succinate dehydrogenase / fumarate reductase, cytochrome b subunit
VTTLVLTITETLRYRGKLGQWSWALHRISGLGVLVFFILHVVDTSWSVFYPDLYAKAIEVYQSPLFTVGEFALVACVIYHALNGLRIAIMDNRPHLWKHQDRAASGVLIATLVLLIPTFLLMGLHVVRHYQDGAPFDLKLAEVVESQLPFVVGIGAVVIGGLLVSGVWSVLDKPAAGKKAYKRSAFDTAMWSYMRISGVLIIPLVFGHLLMMHVIQGVFDITKAGHIPVGTLAVNASGHAAEFVMHRWQTMFAGVMIWRVYDALLLALVSIHAFYGLHYVVNDYINNKVVRRGAQIAVLVGCVIMITVGGAALITSSPETTNRLLQQNDKTSQIIQINER